jgi:hypothetical protein
MTPYELRLAQQLFVNCGSSLKRIEIIKVDNRIALMKGGIVKPSLWQSSNQGHLPTLEPQPNAPARARLLPFITLAAGFAMTGAFTAAQAFYAMSRSRSRP